MQGVSTQFKSVRLVLVTMVRNECDIIEPFIRHHVPIVDHIHVLLHASTDATAAILDRLLGEGLPLTVEREENLAFSKEARFNALIDRAVLLHDPQLIIPLDADEFIVPPDRGQIEREMAAVPEGGALWVRWETYLPTPNDDLLEANPLRRIRHRRHVEEKTTEKVFFSRSSYRRPDVVLVDGQHHLSHRDGLPITHIRAKGLSLAHFPVRSGNQFVCKIVLGWLSRRLSPERTSNHSREWQRWFDRLRPEFRISDDNLPKFAAEYYSENYSKLKLNCDPVETGSFLRYADMVRTDAMSNVIAFSDLLVGRLGRLDAVVSASGIDRKEVEKLLAERAELQIEVRNLQREATESQYLRMRLKRSRRRVLALIVVLMALVALLVGILKGGRV